MKILRKVGTVADKAQKKSDAKSVIVHNGKTYFATGKKGNGFGGGGMLYEYETVPLTIWATESGTVVSEK
jgi:hypothetical protein